MKEIWRDIIGYKGLYKISNLGNIKSSDRIEKGKPGTIRKRKGTKLKPSLCNEGYYRVCLLKDSKRNYVFIHRLVAFAFVSNVYNKPEVNHIDSIKTNNTKNVPNKSGSYLPCFVHVCPYLRHECVKIVSNPPV